MTNVLSTKDARRVYDLQERTAKFGKSVITLMRSIRRDAISMPLISQTVRSATSVGANYMEADGSNSKKEFTHRIGIAKKEAKETMHWCDMLIVATPDYENELLKIRKEAHELVLIFSSIVRSAKGL